MCCAITRRTPTGDSSLVEPPSTVPLCSYTLVAPKVADNLTIIVTSAATSPITGTWRTVHGIPTNVLSTNRRELWLPPIETAYSGFSPDWLHVKGI
ncbi:hypothetical protein PGT21_020701 [Puccinia graminis f. sp. tritici]|uniref:Uncharacterized protein n=1 Tax=Puccinia graminis f. sp. tritici TaxID=56615 RepID=A0A5B0N111_PUCGR|nr:hypothetical protein PGT21_020701 [Puccinia graminis f. sp. tritici]KAA1124135.1 hypothetical protein PGTUg99_029341 [Puccinia graminis f. sp. tritici]